METLIEFKNILEPLKSEPILLVLTVLVGASLYFMFRLASKALDNRENPKK
jgi:hypothetical protein